MEKRGDHLLVTKAMKLETPGQAPFEGVINAIRVRPGEDISTGDLLIEIDRN